MSTSITRPYKDRRTPAEKQEAALLAAFRRRGPRERFKLLRAARQLPLVRPIGIHSSFSSVIKRRSP
jgi:hypothetical protein